MPHPDDPEILYVDDSRDDFDFLDETCREAKLRARIAHCAHPGEVIPRIMASASRPVVVIIDVVMPEMSGIDLLRALRNHAELQQIMVIILSTTIVAGDRTECERLGAIGIMEKPHRLDGYAVIIEFLTQLLDISRGETR